MKIRLNEGSFILKSIYSPLLNFPLVIDDIEIMCNKIMRKRRRWSFVRIFVSLMPEILWKYVMPRSIRLHFSQNLNIIATEIKCDRCQMHSSPKNFTSFKSYLSSNNKLSEISLSSTPKLEGSISDTRISDIQKDLQQLKDQVAKILRQQQENLQSSDYGSLNNQSPDRLLTPKIDSKSFAAPPPPPPPPPPPLPLNLLTAKSSQGAIAKPRADKQKRPKPPVEGYPCGEELLKDLRKVQLKKVQKSPGGGPLKKHKQDPGNFLEEVLKKRFNYIQNISSDASHDSTVDDKNDSFDNPEEYLGISKENLNINKFVSSNS